MTGFAELNLVSPERFTELLGGVFEHSPWVAERAVAHRPFGDPAALHRALCDVVADADATEQLALVRAHPDLAGRMARAGGLTTHSAAEQAGLGLDRLADAEFERFDRLNRFYRDKFGFPFVVAVRRHDRASLLATFEARLRHDPAVELRTALDEVGAIAGFRLAAMFAPVTGQQE